MEMKENMKKLFAELNFSDEESKAFLKSIQVMKEAQHDDGINPLEKFQELMNEVVDNEI